MKPDKKIPQALDFEEAVLGAMILEADGLYQAIDLLTEDSFYDFRHKEIFKAIQSLYDNDEAVDILTVVRKLKENNSLDIVGGSYFISQLTNKIASSANIEYYIRILQQKQIQREIIKISRWAEEDAFKETTDVLELLDNLTEKVNKINGILFKRDISHISEHITLFEQKIKTIKENAGKQVGLPSGIKELDRVTNGFHATDLVILAARPGMGKTGLALTFAKSCAKSGNGVAFFSLEMGSIQLIQRLIAQESGIYLTNIRYARISPSEEDELIIHADNLKKIPLYIDDTASLTMRELKAKCLRLKREHDIKMVVVDYLQLITPSKNSINRDQQIGEISRGLKVIAKELDVCVIALSQLSRNVEQRGGSKKPLLSDLRESGNIEQDADIVMFIWRPDYYGMEKDEEGNSLKGLAEISIAKHRNGSLDDVVVRFEPHTTAFKDNYERSYTLEGIRLNKAKESVRNSFNGYAPDKEDDLLPF